MPESPRVLVIRRRYLGDVVLLGPVLRNLRLHWPGAELSVAVDRAFAEVLALNPDVGRVLIFPRSLGAWPAFLRELRSARFTHVFNFDNTEGTALAARLSGAPFRLGLHHGGYRLKLRRFYTCPVNDPNEEHESRPITEYYLRSLPAAGVPVASREVRLEPRAEDLAALRPRVGASGPVLLVHPGSRSAWRVWPAERFAAVCDRAQDELGAQVVLAGGPGDGPRIAEIRRRAKSHLLAFEQPLSAPRFAALARLARLVLCHDSGPMHVAAAVGTPVVALYGSQNAALFRPAGDGHVLLQPSLPCAAACVAPGQCVPGDSYRSLCVRRLGTEEVFAAVRTALARAAAPPRS
jgi:lipopolysaccharide heptosyltransferase III